MTKFFSFIWLHDFWYKELETDRKRLFFIVAIILIGIGASFYWIHYFRWFLRVHYFWNACKHKKISRCGEGIRCSTVIYLSNFTTNNGVQIHTYSVINFTTSKVFSALNRINYTVNSVIEPKDSVKNMYFFLVNTEDDVKGLFSLSVPEIIEEGKNAQRLLEPFKISPTEFYRSGSWSTPSETSYSIFGIIIAEDNSIFVNNPSKKLFTIQSDLAKLQADTNTEIIKQVRE